jgi:hypothetical protein
LLLGNRRWLVGFAAETVGWLVYVAALRLAPISLVQAICASGIAVLAFATAHGHLARLARHEQIAVVIAFAGLVLLSFSLVDTRQVDHSHEWAPIVLWFGCSATAALTLARMGIGLARGPALGLAAGLLFAGGDISAKLVVYGGIWFVAVLTLIVCYALGTSILQGAFQHGDALTGAGLATLATNAIPIAAGFFVFGEQLCRSKERGATAANEIADTAASPPSTTKAADAAQWRAAVCSPWPSPTGSRTRWSRPTRSTPATCSPS